MIACIRVPEFAISLRRQAEPSTAPLIVVRYASNRGKVIALSTEAADKGVKVGMSVPRARAICPTAQVILATPTQWRQALESLQTVLTEYSQWIELERGVVQTAIFYVDLGRLRPSEGYVLAARIREQFQARGFATAIGLASNRFTALAAASEAVQAKTILVAPGDEARFLAHKPVALLPLEPETARRLELFGLKRLGQLVALPRSALIAQFGKSGGKLHKLASGEDARRIGRYTPPRREYAVQTFDVPLEDRQIVDAALKRLASGVMAVLSEQGLSLREIGLTVIQEDGMEVEAHNRPYEAVSSGAYLERLTRRLLTRMEIRAGVREIRLQVGRLTPTVPHQLSLFDTPTAADPRALLLDLAEHYGEGCFYTVTIPPSPPPLPEWRFVLEKVEAL